MSEYANGRKDILNQPIPVPQMEEKIFRNIHFSAANGRKDILNQPIPVPQMEVHMEVKIFPVPLAVDPSVDPSCRFRSAKVE